MVDFSQSLRLLHQHGQDRVGEVLKEKLFYLSFLAAVEQSAILRHKDARGYELVALLELVALFESLLVDEEVKKSE